MRGNPFGLLFIVVLLCVNGTSYPDDKAQARIQGVWKVVKYVENGTIKPEETDTLMTIEGNTISGEMIFKNRKATEIWTASLIVGKGDRRNHLDIVLTCRTAEAGGGPLLKYTVLPGIYSLKGTERNGEELAISVSDEDGERPTGFEPKIGHCQWTFKRANLMD